MQRSTSIRRLRQQARRAVPAPVLTGARAVFRSLGAEDGQFLSFGQNGEDAVLQRHFTAKEWAARKKHQLPPTGFYVDVGAHKPKLLSNSYAFYLAGGPASTSTPLRERRRRSTWPAHGT